MHKLAIALLLALALPVKSDARERPITSCDKAPRLAEFQKQLPGYILESEASKPAKAKSKSSFNPSRLLSGGSPVCIVMVVDKTGKVRDAIVAYPETVALTPSERDKLMAMDMEPAELEGVPHDSFTIMSATIR